MKHLWCLVAALVLAANAAAVEVTVKTKTKLYGRTGQLLMEVEAGVCFDAQLVRGEWVWGSMLTKTGAARGWIPLKDLECDEEARRRLAAAQPTAPATAQPAAPKPEPVLLRYAIEPDEVQPYQLALNLTIPFTATAGEGSADITIAVAAKLGYTIRGKKRDKHGDMPAEVRFTSYAYQYAFAFGNTTVRATVDSSGVKVYVNGALADPGEIGLSRDKVDAVRELLKTKFEIRFDNRGQMSGDKTELNELSKKLPGVDLEEVLTSRPIYPSDKVPPGGSWVERNTHLLDNPNRPGDKVPMVGSVKHTYSGRGTHRGRSCVKLKLSGKYQNHVDVLDCQRHETTAGSVIVDEATGIPLDTVASISTQVVGAIEGVTYTGKGNGTLRIRYTGSKAD